MKVLIVDDEPLARERIKQILSSQDQRLQLLEAGNGLRAVESCRDEQPDLVLMDIRMPGMDGLEAAQHISQLANPPALIFTTAYDEYALQAFKASAVDYLLKPVRESELLAALEKAKQLNKAQLAALQEESNARTNITAKISGNIKLIPVSDIFYFQAEQKYVTVRYKGGETIIEDTLKQLQDEFARSFIRIHRNALVAKAYISGIHKDSSGRTYITLRDCDKQLEISRRHLSSVKQVLQQL